MFDDPREELARLQRKLLEAEEEPQEEEEDPEQALDEMKEMLRREDWEESSREPLYRSYTDVYEEPEEQQPAQTRSESVRRKKKGNTGVIVTAILEVIALLTFLGWWILWKM